MSEKKQQEEVPEIILHQIYYVEEIRKLSQESFSFAQLKILQGILEKHDFKAFSEDPKIARMILLMSKLAGCAHCAMCLSATFTAVLLGNEINKVKDQQLH